MLIVDRIEKSYRKQKVLHQISFACRSGECVGIIGESGSGKSTLGRLIIGMERPDKGAVFINGVNTVNRKARFGSISAVFQDYTSSINPYFTVERALMEALSMLAGDSTTIQRKIDDLLEQVGLHSSYRKKHAHELSGGEVQRVCIARAVAIEPEWILFDEAVSSLDASVQLQVLDLLKQLKRQSQTGYLFITHDIQAAAYLCDRILIMRGGQIEETANLDQLRKVQSPYAKQLIQMAMM